VNKVLEPGRYSYNFRAAEDLASGIYIYRLQTNEKVLTRKMLFVK